MILLDIPVVAYKTMAVSIYTDKGNGLEHDYEAEERFKTKAAEYRYSREHEHVRSKYDEA